MIFTDDPLPTMKEWTIMEHCFRLKNTVYTPNVFCWLLQSKGNNYRARNRSNPWYPDIQISRFWDLSVDFLFSIDFQIISCFSLMIHWCMKPDHEGMDGHKSSFSFGKTFSTLQTCPVVARERLTWPEPVESKISGYRLILGFLLHRSGYPLTNFRCRLMYASK